MTHFDCETAAQRFRDYRRGVLPGAERRSLEAHLKECQHCRDELRFLEALDGAAAHTLPPLEISAQQRMLAAIQAGAAPRRRWPSMVPMVFALGVAAAAGWVMVIEPMQDSQGIPGSHAWTKVVDHATVTALSKGVARSAGTPLEPRLDVEKGSTMVAYRRAKKGGPLRIRTPHCEIKVLGTALVVDVGRERTQVTVQRGKVEIHLPGGKRRVLPAGLTLSVGPQIEESTLAAPRLLAEVGERLPVSPLEHHAREHSAREHLDGSPSPHPVPVEAPAMVETPRSAKPTRRGRRSSVVSRDKVQLAEGTLRQLEAAREAWEAGDQATSLRAVQEISAPRTPPTGPMLEEISRLIDGFEARMKELEVAIDKIEAQDEAADPAEVEPLLKEAESLARGHRMLLGLMRGVAAERTVGGE